ncbi:MAG: LamG domain-containing protein, partial [Verrucomicrobia bacterium]|nr:LamG domain-containing protein [Verrucomicrobiota bacterium]
MNSYFVTVMVSSLRVLLCHLVSALGLLLLPTVLGATPVCAPTPEGMVAWWRAESNTWDSVNLNDAVLPGSPPTPYLFTNGKVGAAFLLGRNLTVPASDELNVGDGEGLTVEGWVKPDSLAGYHPLIEWNDGKDNVGAGLMLNYTCLEGWLTDTNAASVRRVVFSSPPGVLTNAGWQHVALMFDKTAGVATLFVNGSAVARTNVGAFQPQTQAPVCLGYRPSGTYSGSTFRGGLDEMTIYNHALSPEEVQAIVAADEAGKCLPPPPLCALPPSDFVAWWRGESNVLDSVNGSHGDMAQSLVYAAGPVGAGFMLNSGYVRVPASSTLDLGKQSGFAVEGWARHSSVLIFGGIVKILEWRGGTTTQGVSLYWNYSAFSPPAPSPVGRSFSPALEANLVDTEGLGHVIRSGTNLITFARSFVLSSCAGEEGQAAARMGVEALQQRRQGLP